MAWAHLSGRASEDVGFSVLGGGYKVLHSSVLYFMSYFKYLLSFRILFTINTAPRTRARHCLTLGMWGSGASI